MKTATYQDHKQIELIEAIQANGINLVTCGNCGIVQLIETNLEEVKCYSCGMAGDQCDYPDLFHRGMTLITEV